MSEDFDGTVSITPNGSKRATITLDSGGGNARLGGNGRDGDVTLQDGGGTERIHLNADGQRMELHNNQGEIIAMMGGAGNIRAGSNGEDGDMYLYRSTATNLFSNGQWSVRLSANDGRLEIRDAQGDLICMLGANGNLRLGSNGDGGDVFLFRSAAGSLFTDSQATVRLSGNAGDMTLGGSGVSGDINLRDTAGNTRVRLRGNGERMEALNASGDVVGMFGANGNLRLGANGDGGDIFLYRNNADSLFDNGNATVRLNGNAGDLTLGGSGVNGDINLRDTAGNTRIRLNPGNERMEVLNTSGEVIGMLGANGNLRLGGNGTDGDVLLYPNSANSLFTDGDATIHMDANAGDITLRNADCAEEFAIGTATPVDAGTVMSLGEDGSLVPSPRANDTAVVGVISGAGAYKPGIVLDRQPGQQDRQPIALMGKTYVFVNDEGGAISIGDLLTTSSIAGQAMRVADPATASGTIIGKAIGTLDAGNGLIPMVISLQ